MVLLASVDTLGICDASVERVGLLGPSLFVSSPGLAGKGSDLGGTDDELSNCLSRAFCVMFPSVLAESEPVLDGVAELLTGIEIILSPLSVLGVMSPD
jgi:hypothetical protein